MSVVFLLENIFLIREGNSCWGAARLVKCCQACSWASMEADGYGEVATE